MLIRFLSWVRGLLLRFGLLPYIKRGLYAPEPSSAGPQAATGWRYRLKLLVEQANYAAVEDVHELPPIHHYWSDKFLAPKLAALGYASVEDFFLSNVQRGFAASRSATPRGVSVGAGNCDFEIGLAVALRDRGARHFVIECIDVNPIMLERGVRLAARRGVSAHIAPVRADFNRWQPVGTYDVVLANQSLHHVANLEGLFDAISRALEPQGLFIASDMIGRNGHMRWPEALEIVNEYWRQLPADHQYNRMLGRRSDEYLNFDCSKSGFEGIRAQDVLPLLVDRYHFDTFIAFGNVIDPFIDRATGYNFDPAREADRRFIDRVSERDEAEILAGRVKPAHMLAVMTRTPVTATRCLGHLTPAFCRRPVDRRPD